MGFPCFPHMTPADSPQYCQGRSSLVALSSAVCSDPLSCGGLELQWLQNEGGGVGVEVPDLSSSWFFCRVCAGCLIEKVCPYYSPCCAKLSLCLLGAGTTVCVLLCSGSRSAVWVVEKWHKCTCAFLELALLITAYLILISQFIPYYGFIY